MGRSREKWQMTAAAALTEGEEGGGSLRHSAAIRFRVRSPAAARGRMVEGDYSGVSRTPPTAAVAARRRSAPRREQRRRFRTRLSARPGAKVFRRRLSAWAALDWAVNGL
uniref:Uncharacterized protein n=1 Tax=Oryza brachyantha TaxID=4533 RepID=J3LJN5_ORYBR